MRQKPKLANAIGDAYQHHSLFGQFLPAVVWVRGSARSKTSAVNPNEHGNPIAGGFSRCPNVQIQAVFVHVRSVSGPLDRFGTKLGGLPNALPIGGGLWCAPAEVPHGWR